MGFVVEEAEQPVMMSPRPVPANLEPPGHVTMHRFPSPATSEPLGRSRRNSVQNRDELGAHPSRTRLAKKDAAGHGLVWIIVWMTLEEDNGVSIVRRWSGTDLRRRRA